VPQCQYCNIYSEICWLLKSYHFIIYSFILFWAPRRSAAAVPSGLPKRSVRDAHPRYARPAGHLAQEQSLFFN
jgi:hypothetical protein